MRLYHGKILASLLVIFTIASAQNIEKNQSKSHRDKRDYEYSVQHDYPRGSSFRLERRISHVPFPHHPKSHNSFVNPLRNHPSAQRRNQANAIPPYAVQMEPLVHYSQRDPLYDPQKDKLIEQATNDITVDTKPTNASQDQRPQPDKISERVYHIPLPNTAYETYPQNYPINHQYPHSNDPEPIIEIIIKESNESLPPPPTLPSPKPKKKEPVQVFYVKYQKDPNGENKLVYDAPIPAITPPTNNEDHHEEHESEEHHDHSYAEHVTDVPRTTTTLRTIIKPESEEYHSDGKVHVTFGTESKYHHERTGTEEKEESAPQRTVVPQPHPPFGHSSLPTTLPPRSNGLIVFPDSHHHNLQKGRSSIGAGPVGPPHGPHPSHPSFGNTHPPHSPIANSHPPINSHGPGNAHGHPIQSPGQVANYHTIDYSQISEDYNNQYKDKYPPDLLTYNPSFGLNSNSPRTGPGPHFPNSVNPQFKPRPQESKLKPQFGESQNPNYYKTIQYRPQNNFNDNGLGHAPNHAPNRGHGLNLPTAGHPPQGHPPQIQQPQPLPHILEPQQSHQYFNGPRNPPPPSSHQQFTFHGPPITGQKPLAPSFHGQIDSYRPEATPIQHTFNSSPNFSFNPSRPTTPVKPTSPPPQQPNRQFYNNYNKPQQEHSNFNQHTIPLHSQQPQQAEIPYNPKYDVTKPQQDLSKYKVHDGAVKKPYIKNSNDFKNQQPFKAQDDVGGEFIKAVPKYEQHTSIQIPSGQEINYQDITSQVQPFGTDFSVEYHQQEQYHDSQPNHVQHSHNTNQATNERNQQHNQRHQENQHTQHAQQHSVQILGNVDDSKPTTNFKTSEIDHNQYLNSYFGQIEPRKPQKPAIETSSAPSIASSYRPKPSYSTTTTTQTPTTEKIATTSAKKNIEFQLPDEVPDELRQQLLSSGILNNADISILDYDKIGDIPLEALPPEHLANFYGAGGKQQISEASENVPVISNYGQKVPTAATKFISTTSDQIEYPNHKPASDVRMKVIQYDKNESVQGRYIRDGAKQVDPVKLNDSTYNKYLPIKINGQQFPIPKIPELKGRNITSVVVLAPLDYSTLSRSERDTADNVEFIAGHALKDLIKDPTRDNFRRWLNQEKAMESDKQSVVLLVTGDDSQQDRDIFMYDISSESVSKLKGELSAAFVQAAETNTSEKQIIKSIHDDQNIRLNVVKRSGA